MPSLRAALFARRVSDVLEQWPSLYSWVMRWRFRGRETQQWLVDRRSDVVIEGFQRSANSFAVRAFRMAQPDAGRRLRIATHIHSPAQIALAARWGIPAILLVRHPDDAVVSVLAWARQLNKLPPEAFKGPDINRLARYWTLRYCLFYERARAYRSHFVMAPFDQVTRDFGSVIDRMNKRFGTAFQRFAHTPEAQDAIFRANAVHLSPSPQRDAFKERFRSAYEDDANAAGRERAERVFLCLDQGAFRDEYTKPV